MNFVDAFRAAGARLSDYTERWVPDAWVICMMLTAVALVLAVVGAGTSPEDAVLAWGAGIWKLLSLGMAILGPHYSTYEVAVSDFKLAREFGMIASMHCAGAEPRTPDGGSRAGRGARAAPALRLLRCAY